MQKRHFLLRLQVIAACVMEICTLSMFPHVTFLAQFNATLKDLFK